MRPTIHEQLSGVDRLLDLADGSHSLPVETSELLSNARRLIKRVATSWDTALPFLLDDNARLTELLNAGVEAQAPAPTDITAVVARNEELRGSLTQLISTIPTDPEFRQRRAEIGQYLQWRVATDPA
ncbi:hypothetical protein CJ179_29865 [Rhodococcus sp. ACS1]|uniref:hypothetical protein n=1 Tax=Rhodococcus TaxID=1827 RepID=UPI000BB16058|nr:MULTISPECIES: hypothetical protein [Rhodococcus]PBC44959.1 hypothetical protein CJ179_29865 [Rhodococcus sp. ACS1]QSE78326.1 hypothetical protein JWS14_03790 [Rhodococcus koreensis]